MQKKSVASSYTDTDNQRNDYPTRQPRIWFP